MFFSKLVYVLQINTRLVLVIVQPLYDLDGFIYYTKSEDWIRNLYYCTAGVQSIFIYYTNSLAYNTRGATTIGAFHSS